MSYVIYGLRAKGEIEVRYVGQTAFSPECRIERETAQARSRVKRCDPEFITPLHNWLLAHDVEGVALAAADTKMEACAKEREMATAFTRLGHRLLNRWLIPAAARIEWRAAGYGKQGAEMRRRRAA